MSKAFTRETDELTEPPSTPPTLSPLPPGSKNYITVPGMARLQQELQELSSEPATEATRQRAGEIIQILRTVVVVAPPPQPWNQVLFGATVTVRNQLGAETVYHIVGKDETDADRNFISWFSPLAKSLLKAHVGQRVRFRAPSGEETLEVLQIGYG